MKHLCPSRLWKYLCPVLKIMSTAVQPGSKASIQGAELLLGVPWGLEGEALGGVWSKTPKKHMADDLQPAEERNIQQLTWRGCVKKRSLVAQIKASLYWNIKIRSPVLLASVKLVQWADLE